MATKRIYPLASRQHKHDFIQQDTSRSGQILLECERCHAKAVYQCLSQQKSWEVTNATQSMP